ncbi:hypothetical protein QFZ99_000853 [Paraburkholderia atlantica]
MDVTMWYGDPGDDQGAQWIMAHPLPGQPPTELQVSNMRKIINYQVQWVDSEGGSGFDPNTIYYRYKVTVTNLGQQAVFFNIQGGGNT